MQPHHPSFEGEAHNLVSNIIFLGRFPTKVLDFLRLKHQKHFCTWALATPLDCTGQRKKPKWRKTKWRESMLRENDKFCANCPSSWSLKTSWFPSEILNKNLEIRCVKGNTFFRAERWIEGNWSAKEAVVCCTHTFFSPKKLRGPEGGPEGGVQVLSTPVRVGIGK